MSNQVNDQIADRVIMEVSELSRVEVFKELFKQPHIDSDFMFNALESVSDSIESDEEIARDLLIEIKFNEAMERPGPHG